MFVVALIAKNAGASQKKQAKKTEAAKADDVQKDDAAKEEMAETAEASEAEVPAADRPQHGPKKIELGDDLVIDLPQSYGFFDREHARKLLEKMGNRTDDSTRGLVFMKDKSWFIHLRYVGDGYVKDDDAADLKPDDILENMKEATEAANEARKQNGFPAMHVVGWTEPPRYERGPHHLVWGIKGTADDKTDSINFYTRVLGRRGYVALNLVDDAATIEAAKPEGLAILRATTFKPGARYEDFDAKHDKVAEYGLAALVVGGAGVAALKLAKVGILAKFSGKLLALLFAAKKLVVLALVALGAFFKRLFGGKSQQPPAAGPPPTDPPPPAP
jgi:uncharacterized membrane-anchored protein